MSARHYEMIRKAEINVDSLKKRGPGCEEFTALLVLKSKNNLFKSMMSLCPSHLRSKIDCPLSKNDVVSNFFLCTVYREVLAFSFTIAPSLSCCSLFCKIE